MVWLLSFVNGAMVWGFVFGQTYRFLPGNSPWLKGVYFGICAWLIMGLLFFPLVDRGIFAATLGLGVAPPVLMLWALLAYSVTMSLVYGFLEKVSADRGSPVDKRESNDPQRLPEPTCAEAIANFTVGVTCTPHQLIAVAAC